MCLPSVIWQDTRIHCSNEGKLPDPKKIHEIVNMPDPKTPQQIQVYTSILCCQSLLSFSNSQLLIHKKLCSLLHNLAFHNLDMLMPDDPLYVTD